MDYFGERRSNSKRTTHFEEITVQGSLTFYKKRRLRKTLPTYLHRTYLKKQWGLSNIGRYMDVILLYRMRIPRGKRRGKSWPPRLLYLSNGTEAAGSTVGTVKDDTFVLSYHIAWITNTPLLRPSSSTSTTNLQRDSISQLRYATNTNNNNEPTGPLVSLSSIVKVHYYSTESDWVIDRSTFTSYLRINIPRSTYTIYSTLHRIASHRIASHRSAINQPHTNQQATVRYHY